MKISVAQPIRRDAIHGRRRDHTAEGARRSKTLVVRHDEQHVGSTLWRHDTRRPPSCRLRGFLPDRASECRIGRWELFPVDGRGGGGRARDANDMLSESGGASKGEKTHARENPATVVHGGSSRFEFLRE